MTNSIKETKMKLLNDDDIPEMNILKLLSFDDVSLEKVIVSIPVNTTLGYENAEFYRVTGYGGETTNSTSYQEAGNRFLFECVNALIQNFTNLEFTTDSGEFLPNFKSPFFDKVHSLHYQEANRLEALLTQQQGNA